MATITAMQRVLITRHAEKATLDDGMVRGVDANAMRNARVADSQKVEP